MAKQIQFFVDIDDNVGGNTPPRVYFGPAPVGFPEAHLNGKRFKVIFGIDADGKVTPEVQEMVRPPPEDRIVLGVRIPGR